MNFVDSPGLNDENIDLNDWFNRERSSIIKDKELSLAIFVCRGTVVRPTKEDYGNFVVM